MYIVCIRIVQIVYNTNYRLIFNSAHYLNRYSLYNANYKHYFQLPKVVKIAYLYSSENYKLPRITGTEREIGFCLFQMANCIALTYNKKTKLRNLFLRKIIEYFINYLLIYMIAETFLFLHAHIHI